MSLKSGTRVLAITAFILHYTEGSVQEDEKEKE